MYDAIKLEKESIQAYMVFIKWDKGILDKHKKNTNPPKRHHKIKVHLNRNLAMQDFFLL